MRAWRILFFLSTASCGIAFSAGEDGTTTGGGDEGGGSATSIGGAAQAGGAGTGGHGGTSGVGGAGGDGGGTGGMAPPPCHPVGLADAFDGNDVSNLWTPQGATETIAVSGGQLHITPDPALGEWAGLVTGATYDFDECAAWVRVPVVYSNATTGFSYFQLVGDDSLKIEARDGNLEMKRSNDMAAVPYDPVAHLWWRIREEGSTVYFETSPDGLDWTTRHSVPTPPGIATMRLGLGLVPGTDPSPPLETRFDDLNGTP